MKSEEIWPRGFREESVQRCEQTDERAFSQTDIYVASHQHKKIHKWQNLLSGKPHKSKFLPT